MVVGFLNIYFFKYHLTFFTDRWRFSSGRTGQTKEMVNYSGLSQIKMNMNKAIPYMQGDGYQMLKIFLNRWKI